MSSASTARRKNTFHSGHKNAASLSPAEHTALLCATHAYQRAQTALAHSLTRKQLQAVSAELAVLRAEKAARESADSVTAEFKSAVADSDAAMRALTDLTAQLRKTHGLTEHHAIDAETGAIIPPENLP